MLNYLPKFFTKRAIGLYFIVLTTISIVFNRSNMAVLWVIFGTVEVVAFFYFANLLTKKWAKLKHKTFSKRIFSTALAIRLVWVVLSYFFYIYMTGQPFEFSTGDAFGYDHAAREIASYFQRGDFSIISMNAEALGISDLGYMNYLGVVYLFTGNSIIIARILKAIWGAWTVVLIYRIAGRNFGESTGRMAGVIAMLFPNLIYYCGLHLKEVEMLFLITAFIERADHLLRSRNFNFINIFVTLLLGLLLFTFRTVLGAAALFALFTALLFSSTRILKMGNRLVITIWLVVAVGYFLGGNIAVEVESLWSERHQNQEESMEWRTRREGGNVFAKYGSATLFAPTIFVIPVSSMVNVVGQENQQLIHGGNYIKNVLAFFVYFILVWIIRNKKWRDFLLIEVFLLAYLAIIALSAFAHSERFHQPAIPFYIMFISYGVSQMTNKGKKYFNGYMVVLFFILIAWNYIKLAGRGMV